MTKYIKRKKGPKNVLRHGKLKQAVNNQFIY